LLAFEFNGTTDFFPFSLIISGATEKVLQFMMPFKSIYNKNLGSVEQKCIFEQYREAQKIRNLLTDIIFFW
jgi:hypothetical protein